MGDQKKNEGGPAPSRASNEVSFLILMGTFNGAAFIEEQLASIENQTASDVSLLVSDDGSSDETLSILQDWQRRWSKGTFEIVKGPRSGFAENFRSLIAGAGQTYDYYAFSDQDDIWDNGKLQTAVEALAQNDSQHPSLYCGRAQLISSNGVPHAQTPLMNREPSFENALVQSIAGANTMVFNNAAMSLLKTVTKTSRFVSHDWISYIWVTGVGGLVKYDPIPTIKYRQHSGNLVGSNRGYVNQFRRIKRALNGQYYEWTQLNLKNLQENVGTLLEENRKLAGDFAHVRKKSRFSLILFLIKKSMFRQSRLGNIALFCGAFLRLI